MSSEFNPLLWFVCKICRQAFPDTDKLKKHQIRKHAEECKNVKCIVFEERFFDKQWIPSDNYFPESSSEFTNENLIEVAPLTSRCGCHCHSTFAVPAETHNESFLRLPKHKPNPYVLVKRLTSEELNAALNRHAENRIFQSNCCLEKKKRTSRCLSKKDNVKSPKQTKEYFNHQENHQGPGQELLADQNKFVSPPKLVQNLVTQTGELNTHVLPEPVEMSPTDPLSTNFYAPLSCLKGIENVQNPEENRLEEAISFTLLEGEIHVELLSGTKQIESSAEHPDPRNQLLPKTRNHKRSPLLSEEQTRNGSKNPLKPNQNSPYVLIKRLTFGELETETQNSEKMITEPDCGCKERKRVRDDNDLSPPKTKNYLQHRNQEQNFLVGDNNSVCNPELFQVIVAPNAEPDRDVFPEDGQFSTISTSSDLSVNAPSDIKYVANIQNMEETDEQLRTETQTLKYQEQHSAGFESNVSKNIWCSRSDQNSADTSTLAQPSLFDFGSLSRADVNDDNETFSKFNNSEQFPIIRNVYSQDSVTEDICPSDSEYFEMENPISPKLSDEVELVEERRLPASVFSEIGVAGDYIHLTQETDTEKIQFKSQQHWNEELNENTVCATFSACPIPCSALTAVNASTEPQPFDTSKSGPPRYSTRAKRKKPEINYSESHTCSNCNHDFDSFDDLQDHQMICTQQNRVDSVNRKIRNSHRPNLIPSSANTRKDKKVTPSVTDDDSDFAAAELENISDSDSESANDDDIKRVKLPEGDISGDAITVTVPQDQKQSQLNENLGNRNLALLEWLKTQKRARFPDGSKNKIHVCTDAFDTLKRLGPKNYITCKLCATELDTEFHLKNHVANCWLHNQSNHLYCIPCCLRFAKPRTLAKHFQEKQFYVGHLQLRRKYGPHILDSNVGEVDEQNVHQRQLPVNDTDLHPSEPVSGDKVLPLLQWLQIQKNNPDNVIALEPDLFQSHSNSTAADFVINESSPIKCKLCLQLLTSDFLLRNHVETCWSQNKAKHRYCVPCNKYYKSGFSLRTHQKSMHKYKIHENHKQESSWNCSVCHKDMKNKLNFRAHQESLDIFIHGKSTHTKNEKFQRNTDVNITGQQGTMMNLSRWLKQIRQVPNSDGTAKLILIDPEPGSSGSKDSDEIEINEDHPITCRICLKTLTQVDDVKNHVKMCWTQNTENHRYCLSCDKGFATPTELQEHKTSEHSAPKNMVLFYCETGGDQSLLNVDGLEVNSDNPVSCKLCETQLASSPEVKLHAENCWFHNKSRHVYCTICDKRFNESTQLQHHNKYRHRNRNSQSYKSVEDKGESETETEKLLPLKQWLKIQKENRNNVITLEPDLLVSETVTESSPVKCKLCQQLFTNESAFRNHVKACWTHNKAKHRYCIPCDSVFETNYLLLQHNKAKHPKHPGILFTCLRCNHEFSTKSELTKHTESLQEFRKQRKNYAQPVKKVNSVNTTGSSNTMSYLFEGLKRLREIKNVDGIKNIILVHPEPTADNFEEINSQNPITCRLCLKKFNTALRLNYHVRNCWTQKKEMHRFCVTCETVFETPQDLQDHSRMEHSHVARASFICKLCSQPFFDEKIFGEHQEAHKDPNFLPFKCPHCVREFKTKEDILKHTSALHKERQKKSNKCSICLKSFNDVTQLNNHNRRAHTGERPFECKFPNCSSTFHGKDVRAVHYRSKHMKELGLEPQQCLCPTCGKTYKNKLTLNQHLKQSHTQNKPYKCTHEGCTKAYKTKPGLTEHVRVHTGEKPYVCEECGKSFAREWGFIKHKRSHAGTLNRAQCHLCPRKFLGGWELKQHLKIHGERKEFKCQFCEVKCATQSYLKKHEKTHGNEPDSDSEDDSKSSAESDVYAN